MTKLCRSTPRDGATVIHVNCLLLSPLLPLAILAAASLTQPSGAAQPPGVARPPISPRPVVPQCGHVSLSAAYLAQVAPLQGPGFLLTLTNDTDQWIKVAKPFPTSTHWYAQTGTGPWLWRASSGSGGALADALRDRGPLFVYDSAAGLPAQYLSVGPHQHLEWVESMQDNPALRFRPGCQRCSNPQDERYRAVLAYAYRPPRGVEVDGLLSCGLRSSPVVMPPLK